MDAVEAPLEAVKCRPRIRRDPNTGIRLPKAKHRTRDKTLKVAAVLQEMLAIDKATGETPSAALLEEAMAEQQEDGDPDQDRHFHILAKLSTRKGSRPKDTCVEPEDPRGWAEAELDQYRKEAKSFIKDYTAETWDKFVQTFRSNYHRMRKSAHKPGTTHREDVDEIHRVEVAFTWDARWYVSLHEKLNKKISDISVDWATKMLISHNKSEKKKALKNSQKPP
ncbi:hypothetical protein CYMTET_52670 [Cymbomonas tetramitiformis]|uniref:Uncharacterized protein n=1 Tax=Cymbomonas tetramitiformis TaxID=36881 RepID=A0AAE0BIK4_9CHLO|nr:hypothetical protein CYMTET_52670 [Cymbomonas tetramitiformis]